MGKETNPQKGSEAAVGGASFDEYANERERLIQQLRDEGIFDTRVLGALARVPRHELVPPSLRPYAYENRPLPIGHGQTISQPFIVALMTQLCELEPQDRVLEIGTGSGYQTAVLNQLAQEVFSVEIVPELLFAARANLERLALAEGVRFRQGDGHRGWPEEAPFDAILVAAAPSSVVDALTEQLRIGGRLVIPVGSGEEQRLITITRERSGLVSRDVAAVRFVPLVSESSLA